MPRFSRAALLLACCTPAGLLLTGCGQPVAPVQSTALPALRPVTAPLPPLSEPRLLAVPGEVRPVAGDYLDSPDAAFRYSERHLQGDAAPNLNPQRIEPPVNGTTGEGTPGSTGPVNVRPAGPPRPLAPAQAGPYSMELVKPIAEPGRAAPPAAPIASPDFNGPSFGGPSFGGPSFVPVQEPATTFQPPPLPPLARSSGPVMGPARDRSGFRAVSERINALNYQAVDLANRGGLYAAREDLLQSLRIAAQSLDAAEGTSGYSQALDQGLTALAEADDFALHSGTATMPMPVADIVTAHRTPVLHDMRGEEISPVIAMQRYYGYAGERLTTAAGELPAAADTLFWLGKVHNSLARQSAQADRLQGPQAMVCFRAALSVAPQHYLAANELGVLLARYGQLHDARSLLQQSVSTRSHVEGWQNLAIVHKRLGEANLAALAEQELIALGGGAKASSNSSAVRWVDPKTFAASGGQSWEQPNTPAIKSAAPIAANSRTTGTRR